jgi:hypothetical protein
MDDGLSVIKKELPFVMKMIARTAQWVHPETFKALPIWCPETARGFHRYDARWSRVIVNKQGVPRKETNIQAAKALVEALGIGTPKPKHWTVCHVWGYDDEKFAGHSKVVKDPHYYSCVGNMIWLPTPLKGFTDAVPEIKACLRFCVFHLYGWVCEHDDFKIQSESDRIRSGKMPVDYPKDWPTAERKILPPGTAQFSESARQSVAKRKAKIRKCLADMSLKHYPRDTVRRVLKFWKVDLSC